MIANRVPRQLKPDTRRKPAVALVFLAPLVGEYLLGNTPITDPGSLLLLAPLYGGGALLIRETARRAGRGWPAMFLFGAAYALLEEGPIDMMFWNPTYGGVDMATVYTGTHIPVLGTSAQMLHEVLTMHTVWSICVPIAIVESFSRDQSRPWLGKAGLAVTAAVFVTGSALLTAVQIADTKFVASPGELAWCSAAVIGLIVLGMRIGSGSPSHSDATAPGVPRTSRAPRTPRPWLVGAAAFAVTSLYWCHDYLPATASPWIAVAGWCVLAAVSAITVARWSRSRDWGAEHRLALAGGALLTYVWVGFTHAGDMAVPRATALIGSTVFAVGALALPAAAAHRVRIFSKDGHGR